LFSVLEPVMRLLGLVVTLIAIALSLPAQAQDADLVSIDTPRGVKQPFILIEPEAPIASVILLTGGHGALGLKGPSSMEWGENGFLVRSRDRFAARKLMVAVLDAPSDREDGMESAFRMGNAHAGDIGAVAAYLKELADVPVWLVGTGSGTWSAAWGAIAADHIDGLVLTSAITRTRSHWKLAQTHGDGVASLPLEEITLPTLIVAHADDTCDITPPAGASKLLKRLENAKPVEVVLLSGGEPTKSEPCEAVSRHGFAGIEDQAVDAIVKFITANSK
jgi:pimeloyl-ACP methyl ester carboxylesterase